jgi:PEP-CTERM motif-containing protein
MNFALHKVASAAAVVLSANLAWAAPITIDVVANPKLLSPNFISLNFGPDTIGLVNASSSKVNALDPSMVNSTFKPNGKYVNLSVGGMGLKALSLNDVTGVIQSLQYGGGFKLSANDDDFTTTGGSLSVSNLRLDLVEKRIYASLNGANGVGSLDNIDLWHIDAITGTTVLPKNSWIPYLDGGGRSDLSDTPFDTSLSGLRFTNQGYALWSQSMGYTSTGKGAFNTVTDFGTITTSAVPEPSIYALFMLGMTGLGLLAARRCAPSKSSS